MTADRAAGGVAVHPVAALLTDEMRARVAAAKFVKHDHSEFLARVLGKVNRRWACPLAVAIGKPGVVGPLDVLYAIDGTFRRCDDTALCQVIDSFIDLIDTDQVAPADVYATLGVEPLAATATADETGGA